MAAKVKRCLFVQSRLTQQITLLHCIWEVPSSRTPAIMKFTAIPLVFQTYFRGCQKEDKSATSRHAAMDTLEMEFHCTIRRLIAIQDVNAVFPVYHRPIQS